MKINEEDIKDFIKILELEINNNKTKINNRNFKRLEIDKELLQQLLPTIVENIDKNYMLKYIDLTDISFDDIYIASKDLSYTNASIDPQKVLGKSLYYSNLEGLDLSSETFTDVCILGSNLEGTGANIDPQKVFGKNLCGTNLKGLDLSEADFTDVIIMCANIKNTGANIDPQKVFEKNLHDTNLEGLDLCEKDFTGCFTLNMKRDFESVYEPIEKIEEYKKYVKSLFQK